VEKTENAFHFGRSDLAVNIVSYDKNLVYQEAKLYHEIIS
jgi:hypothetical protein